MLRKTKEEKMTPVQKEVRIRHSVTNIKRSRVLIKRALNALSFASESLEDVGRDSMIVEINISKGFLGDAARRLSDLYEENDNDCIRD